MLGERGILGQTVPQMTLPIGCRGRVDGDSRTFAILEAAVVEGSHSTACAGVGDARAADRSSS